MTFMYVTRPSALTFRIRVIPWLLGLIYVAIVVVAVLSVILSKSEVCLFSVLAWGTLGLLLSPFFLRMETWIFDKQADVLRVHCISTFGWTSRAYPLETIRRI